jgi:hypothetical protein
MKEESKRKLLSFVYYNIHPMKLIVSKSFDDFKKENLYFLDGLTQKQIKKEYDYFSFYETLIGLKLKINKKDIIQYIDNQ